jgi:hypothetical protein
MLEQRILEIDLYFDARTGPATKAHMSLEDVGKRLLAYPLHYFRGRHNMLFAHELPPESPRLLMFYNHKERQS